MVQENNNIEGMELLLEHWPRRIRPIAKLIKVERQEPVMVLGVDHEKGYIDLSKHRLSTGGIAGTTDTASTASPWRRTARVSTSGWTSTSASRRASLSREGWKFRRHRSRAAHNVGEHACWAETRERCLPCRDAAQRILWPRVSGLSRHALYVHPVQPF
eukprot:evm.model.scf_379.5 EVM.evm.TU.scf_379.5   scf_379:42937-43493(-)